MLEQIEKRYTIPRPGVPVVVWVLGVTVVLGLGALGWAAFVAFRQVHPVGQAALFAGLIEVGAVAEAWALVRGKGWREKGLPIVGALIVLYVSGRYNLVQVQAEAVGTQLSKADMYALALGPLVVMLSLALMLGREWGTWEQAVVKWEQDRQEWVEKEVQRLERREERRDRKLSESSRKDTGAGGRKVPGQETESSGVPLEKGAESSGESSGDVSVKDWRKVPANWHVRIAAMSTKDIQERFELDTRTALNWQTRARRAVGNGYHVEEV